MFFVEIGKPLDRPGQVKTHGEWNFLIEMTEWRFETSESVLVGSDDAPEFIDAKFQGMDLGLIESADVLPPTFDINITFSSGCRLRTFAASALYAREDRKYWMLFCPDDNVWVARTLGGVELRSRYA